MRALLVILVVAACSGGAGKRNDDLITDVREFQEGLRWRNYQQAAEHISVTQRAQFLDAHEELDSDLRIDDYEVVRVTVAGDSYNATVRVKYTWHMDSVGRVNETTVDQRWERQGKVWRVVGTAHRSGVALPEETLPVESEGRGLP